MGSSGSGKTSLIDILSNRRKSGNKTGEIYYGNDLVDSSFQRISGYVLQDPLLMTTMSVREVLLFSANLKLPIHFPYQEKMERIERILVDLNISHIADSKIGGIINRGISGGEKKRVAIAMELVHEPSILFLDEPTSGLDSFNSEQVMLCLKNLTKKGKTVILSIHQPSSQLFSLIDQLILLANGKLAYFGAADEVSNHFLNLGYKIPKNHNVPDFIIDTIETASRNKEERENGLREIDFIINSYHDKNHSVEFVSNTILEGDLGVNETPKKLLGYIPMKLEYNTSFFTQFYYLTIRCLKNLIRNPFLLPGHLILCIVVGIGLGWVYYKIPLDLAGVQNRMGAVFISTFVLALGSMTSLEIFIQERSIYLQEKSNGMYSSWAYYFSKIIFDVIPLRIIPPFFMGTIMYFMIGLRQEAESYIWFILTFVLFNVACGGICLILSVLFSRVSSANLIALSYFLISLLFGGYLVNTTQIKWSKYISIFQFAIEAILSNELVGTMVNFNPTPDINIPARGEQILQSFGFDHNNFALDFGILFGLSIINIFVAGIINHFQNEKR